MGKKKINKNTEKLEHRFKPNWQNNDDLILVGSRLLSRADVCEIPQTLPGQSECFV